jgi:hypothetical protein
VKKQFQRNHQLFDINPEEMPVYGTIASQFNDPGMNRLYKAVMEIIKDKTNADLQTTYEITDEMSEKIFIIPPARTRYLSEISENNRSYDKWVNKQVEIADKLYSLKSSIEVIPTIEERGPLVLNRYLTSRNAISIESFGSQNYIQPGSKEGLIIGSNSSILNGIENAVIIGDGITADENGSVFIGAVKINNTTIILNADQKIVIGRFIKCGKAIKPKIGI